MRFAALVLCCLAGPAGASCLSLVDMARGVEARFADGGTALLRREVDGTVRVDEAAAGDGTVVRSILARGFWEVRSFELGPDGWPAEGSGLEMLYAVEPRTMPEPRAGLRWTGWATPVFEGMVLRSDTLTVEAREAPPLELDGCAYEAVAVEVLVERATEGEVRLGWTYLPELGAGFLLRREAEGEAPEERRITALTARR